MSPIQLDTGVLLFDLPTQAWAITARVEKDDTLTLHQYLVLGVDASDEESEVSEHVWVFDDEGADPGAATTGYLKRRRAFDFLLGFHYGERLSEVALPGVWSKRATAALHEAVTT